MIVRTLLLLLMATPASAQEAYDYSFIDWPIGQPVSTETQARRQDLKDWYVRRLEQADKEGKFSFERLYVKATPRMPGQLQKVMYEVMDEAKKELSLAYPKGVPVDFLRKIFDVKEPYLQSSCKDGRDNVIYCHSLLVIAITDDASQYDDWGVRISYDSTKNIKGISLTWDSQVIPNKAVPFHY